MAYGDTMEHYLVDGEEKRTLRLTYNANTYLIYKRFFDSDLMSDILKATKSDKPLPKDIQDKIESGELTVDNLDSVNLDSLSGTMIDTTFVLQVTIAMIATYERRNGQTHSVEEIADTLPGELFMDYNFMNKLMDFLMFGIKKKKVENKG